MDFVNNPIDMELLIDETGLNAHATLSAKEPIKPAQVVFCLILMALDICAEEGIDPLSALKEVRDWANKHKKTQGDLN